MAEMEMLMFAENGFPIEDRLGKVKETLEPIFEGLREKYLGEDRHCGVLFEPCICIGRDIRVLDTDIEYRLCNLHLAFNSFTVSSRLFSKCAPISCDFYT